MSLGQQLKRAFERLGAGQSPSEHHGVLCGLLCARGSVGLPEWLAVIAGRPAAGEGRPPGPGEDPLRVLSPDQAEATRSLYRETVACLESAEGLLQPLLPGEGVPLFERSLAMADWCGGFLYGLAEGGIGDLSVLPPDVREVAGDLTEISRVSADEDAEEEDEVAYAELVEYLRAGVTLVYETLEAERRDGGSGRTIH